MAYHAFCSLVNMQGTSGKSRLFVSLVQSKYPAQIFSNVLNISLRKHLVFHSVIADN
jgi:hypothetical protein